MTRHDFDTKMRQKYPHLFDSEESDWPISMFGFEISPGWYDLVDELLSKLDKKVKLVQVKQKFGHLTVYQMHGDETDEELIREYELKSVYVCEVCGKAGKRRNHNFCVYVACDEHVKEDFEEV